MLFETEHKEIRGKKKERLKDELFSLRKTQPAEFPSKSKQYKNFFETVAREQFVSLDFSGTRKQPFNKICVFVMCAVMDVVSFNVAYLFYYLCRLNDKWEI